MTHPVDVKAILESQGYEPLPVRQGVWQVTHVGANATWKVFVTADAELCQSKVYSCWPERVPAARRGALMEFTTRANYGLTVATFELDLDDGEIRLRSYYDFAHGFEPKALFQAFKDNMTVMDRYVVGMTMAIQSDADPTDLVRRSEAG